MQSYLAPTANSSTPLIDFTSVIDENTMNGTRYVEASFTGHFDLEHLDGWVREVLGDDLHPPATLAVDAGSNHFDPSVEEDASSSQSVPLNTSVPINITPDAPAQASHQATSRPTSPVTDRLLNALESFLPPHTRSLALENSASASPASTTASENSSCSTKNRKSGQRNGTKKADELRDDEDLHVVRPDEIVSCRWDGCSHRDRAASIWSHIEQDHGIRAQAGTKGSKAQVACLWEECRQVAELQKRADPLRETRTLSRASLRKHIEAGHIRTGRRKCKYCNVDKRLDSYLTSHGPAALCPAKAEALTRRPDTTPTSTRAPDSAHASSAVQHPVRQSHRYTPYARPPTRPRCPPPGHVPPITRFDPRLHQGLPSITWIPPPPVFCPQMGSWVVPPANSAPMMQFHPPVPQFGMPSLMPARMYDASR